MTSRAPDPATSVRLEPAVRWTGAGAAAALATVLLMLGMYGLWRSLPVSGNVREPGIDTAFAIVGLASWLAVVAVAGWRLARPAAHHRGWLRALPALASVTWFVLVTTGFAAMSNTNRGAANALPAPQFDGSILIFSPIVMGILLTIVFLLLAALRAMRRSRGD